METITWKSSAVLTACQGKLKVQAFRKLEIVKLNIHAMLVEDKNALNYHLFAHTSSL